MRKVLNHKRKLMLAYLASMGLILLLANSGATDIFRSNVGNYIPQYDKVLHFTLLGSLAFIVPFALLNGDNKDFYLKHLLIFSLIAIGVTAEEFSQKFIDSRSFNYYDLLADYLGLLTFSIIYLLSRRIKVFQSA